MKKILLITIGIALVIGGLYLISIGFNIWKEAGFVIESRSKPFLLDGTSSLMIIFMGIGLTAFGVYDFILFRRNHKINNDQHKLL